ncbi:MAG: ATP-binding protein [Firmicutes bacterium]|nr:ATP-binding protein [Bacillota bacterium]
MKKIWLFRNLWIAIILVLLAIGTMFYFHMMHLECIVSFSLALIAGVFFALHLTVRHKKSLQKQEELRKELTADIAHELRTPLTSIGTHLEMMIEGVWDAAPERLQGCYDEVMRLGKMVEDMDILAKAESKKLKLDLEDVDLLEVAKIANKDLEIAAQRLNISVAVEGEKTIVKADRLKIQQVFINLLSNAIKYSNDGGKVGILVSDKTFTITDNGIGIADSDLPYIFERFYRVDKSRSRTTGGTGIGLAIVRSIIKKHGGTIKAASELGKGSKFTVRFK